MDRTATLVLFGIASGALAVIVLAAYPALFVGTSEGALAKSLYEARDIGNDADGTGYERCRESDGEWTCGPYRVDVDWRGCWEAVALIGVRPGVSGCIGLGDVLGLTGPPFEPS
jgi:hypothetical protein